MLNRCSLPEFNPDCSGKPTVFLPKAKKRGLAT